MGLASLRPVCACRLRYNWQCWGSPPPSIRVITSHDTSIVSANGSHDTDHVTQLGPIRASAGFSWHVNHVTGYRPDQLTVHCLNWILYSWSALFLYHSFKLFYSIVKCHNGFWFHPRLRNRMNSQVTISTKNFGWKYNLPTESYLVDFLVSLFSSASLLCNGKVSHLPYVSLCIIIRCKTTKL